MTQEEWDLLFRQSARAYQDCREAIAGRMLFPAHAGKIMALAAAAELTDAPRNPGRKDDKGVDVLLSHTPCQALFTPKVD
jgi:hypothetical protein